MNIIGSMSKSILLSISWNNFLLEILSVPTTENILNGIKVMVIPKPISPRRIAHWLNNWQQKNIYPFYSANYPMRKRQSDSISGIILLFPNVQTNSSLKIPNIRTFFSHSLLQPLRNSSNGKMHHLPLIRNIQSN